VVAGAGTWAHAASSTGPSSSWRPTREQVQLVLADAAKSAGPASATGWPKNVTAVDYVASTRGPANAALGDQADNGDATQVIVVRMAGTWANDATNVSIPPGGEAPGGSSFTLVVDAATGRTLDFSIGDNVPKIEVLGTPVPVDIGVPPTQ